MESSSDEPSVDDLFAEDFYHRVDILFDARVFSFQERNAIPTRVVCDKISQLDRPTVRLFNKADRVKHVLQLEVLPDVMKFLLRLTVVLVTLLQIKPDPI